MSSVRAINAACLVALLAEGVDRNVNSLASGPRRKSVALLAEGVDRNHVRVKNHTGVSVSPSSRRAWIEIEL